MSITSVNSYANIYENIYVTQKREQDASMQRKQSETEGAAKAEETAKKSEASTAQTAKRTGNSGEYLAQLKRQVPYMTLETGFGLSTKRDNRAGVIAINPKLLEKMQNDPQAEEKYTQTLKDIERAEKTANAYYNALGGCVERTSHWYIDENGKYCHFAYTYRDDKLNEKLREERKENAEGLIEKTRQKARERKEQLAEQLEEKDKELRPGKSGSAQDGVTALGEEDMQTMTEQAEREEAQTEREEAQAEREGAQTEREGAQAERTAKKAAASGRAQTNFDLRI